MDIGISGFEKDVKDPICAACGCCDGAGYAVLTKVKVLDGVR